MNDNSNEVLILAPSDLVEGDRNSGILPGWNAMIHIQFPYLKVNMKSFLLVRILPEI